MAGAGEEKKSAKDRMKEEWTKNFLAERAELNDDTDATQPEPPEEQNGRRLWA